MTNPLDEFAPFPRTVDEVTAESLLRYETVAAFVHMIDTTALRRKAFGAGGTKEDRQRYADASNDLAQRIGMLLLLRHIKQQSSASWADEVAKQLHAVWDDGGFGEFLHDWLCGYGIDPEQVIQAVARQEAEAVA